MPGHVAHLARLLTTIDGNLDAKLLRQRVVRIGTVPAPLAFRKLALRARAQGPASLKKALSRATRAVPNVARARESRCELTPAPEGPSFRNPAINAFLARVFRAAARSAGETLPKVDLSRFDLFHGHVFLAGTGDLGILLHAKEYPALCETFPYDLGYCQAGSPVHVDERALDYRNLLWYKGMILALDLSDASPLLGALVRPELRPLRTTYEGDFGVPLFDVYMLPSSAHKYSAGPADDVFCYMRRT